MSGQEPGVGQSRVDWNHLSLLVTVNNTGSPKETPKGLHLLSLQQKQPLYLHRPERQQAAGMVCGGLVARHFFTSPTSLVWRVELLHYSQTLAWFLRAHRKLYNREFQSSDAFWNAAEHHTPRGSIITPVVQTFSTAGGQIVSNMAHMLLLSNCEEPCFISYIPPMPESHQDFRTCANFTTQRKLPNADHLSQGEVM